MNTEDQITAWFAAESDLPSEKFPIGIGDDMAEVRVGDGSSVLVTCDMLLDGVHFDLKVVSPEQAGYKAAAVSLSDCAAMATEPVAMVASVALPAGFGDDELKEIYRGLTRAGKKYGCELIGGDITSWKGEEKFAISVTMLSRRPAGIKPVMRSGAKAGDRICVTGSLGGSRAGKHLTFEPRVKEAIKIAQMVELHSMIDISDGLSSDLNRICAASKKGAVIEAEKIPISAEAGKSSEPLNAALNDGEDFELLFTLSQENCAELLRQWDGALSITCIGEITAGDGLRVREGGKISELKIGGYDHLK